MNVRLASGARGILAASSGEWEIIVRISCFTPSICCASVQGVRAGLPPTRGMSIGVARIEVARERMKDVVRKFMVDELACVRGFEWEG